MQFTCKYVHSTSKSINENITCQTSLSIQSLSALNAKQIHVTDFITTKEAQQSPLVVFSTCRSHNLKYDHKFDTLYHSK